MRDRYEYEDGQCTVCHEDTKVRWKNIWLIGSEGTWLCHRCEMDMLKHLRAKSYFFALEKKEKFKQKKKERKNEEAKRCKACGDGVCSTDVN